jgi:uncharacterized protein YndB with AHSA1/START domain
MEIKNIKQEVIFNVPPKDVFEALMDSKKHAEFTGSKAEIDRVVGGAFSLYDGYLSGSTSY